MSRPDRLTTSPAVLRGRPVVRNAQNTIARRAHAISPMSIEYGNTIARRAHGISPMSIEYGNTIARRAVLFRTRHAASLRERLRDQPDPPVPYARL